MSKRDQGASLNTYIEEGFLPEAVRNYLCLLGWSPKDNREKIDDRRSRQAVRAGENPSQERLVRSRQMHLAEWRICARADATSVSRSWRVTALERAGIDLSKFSDGLRPRRARNLQRQVQNL